MARKENTRRKDWKRIILLSLSLIMEDIITYIENPRVSTNKLLELTYEFKKVSEHRVNINHQLYFLCQQQTENKSIHGPFTTAPKQIKYLGINLTKKT